MIRNKKISFLILLFFGVLASSFFLKRAISAWNDPTTSPSLNNAPAPLNIGAGTQTKSGSLSVKTLSVNDGATPCCAGYYTVSINEGGANQPTLQFHDSGIAEGQIILQSDIGGGQRGFLFQSTQTTMGAKFTGNLLINGEGQLGGVSIKDGAAAGWTNQLRWYAQDSTTLNHFFFEDRDNNDQLVLYLKYAGSAANNTFAIKNGSLAVDNELCLASDGCRSTWPREINTATCPSGQLMTGINASGDIICTPVGGFYWSPNPCESSFPPSGKRIFVTSSTFTCGDVDTYVKADNACAAAATAGGYPGTYKALIYLGARQPNEVLTAGNSFYNGAKSEESACAWTLVANDATDFFTDDGGGVYLRAPIRYNEQGLEISNITVWTGFKPTGSGNFTTTDPLQATWGVRSGACVKKCNGACQTGKYSFTSWTYTGTNTISTVDWAGAYTGWTSCISASSCSGNGNLTQCTGNSFAIYCVEQ